MRGLEQVTLDAPLARLAADGLVKAGGKQRTDSTHVVTAVAALNRLQLAGEAVRAALEALTAAHPDWLEQRIWRARFRPLGTPMTSWRPPRSQARRRELAIAYARDGYALLEAVYHPLLAAVRGRTRTVWSSRRCCSAYCSSSFSAGGSPRRSICS